MRRRAIGVGIALVVLVMSGVAVGRHPLAQEARPPESEAAPVRVRTLSVQSAVFPEMIEVTGSVQAHLTADVAAKITGRVARVEVREGDRLRVGQVLVRLEAADLAAQVRQADAAVAAARAGAAQAETSALIQETHSSTRVEQARAALSLAREQYSMVKEGARRQQKRQADESVRQAEAGKSQADEGVAQARAGLATAHAQMSLVREGARRQQKLQADAALRQAEVGLKIAEATYNRYHALAQDGAISRQQFDEVAIQREVARAQHETAREQASMLHEGARTQELQQAEEASRRAEAALRQARQKLLEAEAALRAAVAQREMVYEGSRSQEIRQAEAQVHQAEEALRLARVSTGENRIEAEQVRMRRAQVAQAEANRTAARVQFSYATLAAPFSGVVIRRHIDPGALASPGVPLITLVDPSAYRLEATAPEARMQGVRLGDRVTVTIDSLGRRFTGRIAQIVPSADPASRTFIVKVSLPRDPRLSPGLFGRLAISAGTTRGVRVPAKALWRRESLTGVFVVEEGNARKRLVTVGRERNGTVEILSGLSPGETLVAAPGDQLADGASVVAAGGQ